MLALADGRRVPPAERGDRRNEGSRVDWFRQVQLETGPERLLAILFARERGERSGGN